MATRNEHALKVQLVENEKQFQNSHALKVQIEGGGKPSIEIVDELPETGKAGEVYWLRKEESGSEDVYDLYEYIDGEWCKIDVDIKLYATTGQNIDGAMTQKATSDALGVLNEKFGGMQLVQLTQAEYDNLATKDPNTLYIIKAN